MSGFETSEGIKARLGGFVPRRTLDDYRARYARYVHLERADGVLEFRIHSDGGPAVLSLAARDAWVQALLDVSNDPENEVVVITGTGSHWIAGIDSESFVGLAGIGADARYDHFYYNSAKLVERAVLGIDVPTIGVVNGPGVHPEILLFSDITVCADTAEFSDGHFGVGVTPGDGFALALQGLIGAKRAALAMYTCEVIDAARALHLGLVSEVHPPDRVLTRAHELAQDIMKAPRVTRRITHTLVQRPWRRLVQEDAGYHLVHELYSSALTLPEQYARFLDGLGLSEAAGRPAGSEQPPTAGSE